MPTEVDSLKIHVYSTAEQAADAVDKVRDSMSALKGEAKGTTQSTDDFADSLSKIVALSHNVAKSAQNMGLDLVAKELKNLAKSADLSKNLEPTQKAIKEIADFFRQSGNVGLAERYEAFSDLYDTEKILEFGKRTEEAEKKRAAEEASIAKEIESTWKKASADYANIEKQLTAEKDAEARKRAAEEKSITEEISSLWKKANADYSRIEKQLTAEKENEAKNRANAERKAIEEAAKSDAAYRKLTQAAAVASAREQIRLAEERAAVTKRIGEESLKYAREAEAAKKLSEDYDAAQASEKAAKAAEKHAKALAEVKKNFSSFGKSLGSPIAKLKELAESFKRIAMYRAIRAAIKAISSAIKEGLTNLYGYSQQVKTAFAPAVDELRKHVLLLKNAFATALRPVIEALIPIIQKLVDWLAKAADFVAQVFSVLTGKVDANNRYTKAVLSDLQDANKQAKELRNTLLGFDEINRLDGQTGGTGAINYGLMFKQAEISPEAIAAAEKIQKIWAKIKEVLDTIDWDLVLKVLAGLYALKILSKIYGWLKPIIALFSGAGGIIALVIAVIAVFGLWGDKIHDFIEKTAIPKTEKFFDKIKKAIPILKPLISTIEEIVLAVEEVVATVAQVIYDLVHGDIDKAWEDLVIGAKKAWEHVKKAVLSIIDGLKAELDYRWSQMKLAFLLVVKFIVDQINYQLEKFERATNVYINTFNELFGTKLKRISLQVDTSDLDDAIYELKRTKLPDLNEKVKVKGTYSQSPFKVNLDTKDANKSLSTLNNKVNEIGRSISNWLSRISSSGSSHSGSGGGFASGGYPAMGSYFYAGEHGAEWVGDINGRTGVMNTDQMADAMYSAMSAALANSQQSGGDIYLDGEVIYRNVVNRNNNQVRSTGRAALLT